MYIKQNCKIFTIASIDIFSVIIIRCTMVRSEIMGSHLVLFNKRPIHVELYPLIILTNKIVAFSVFFFFFNNLPFN